ncbi:MAG: TlpA family protein disulfide reductase, partial [Anaerolineae bacterium]
MSASSRGRLLRGVLFLVVLGFLFLFGTALRGKGAGPLTEGPAPNLTLQLFEGGAISLEELRGEIVVINF